MTKTFFVVTWEYEGKKLWKYSENFDFIMHLVNDRGHNLVGYVKCENKKVRHFIRTIFKGEV